MPELWKRENYTIDADFIIGSNIHELDIEKCNINILYNAGVIDLNTYNWLYTVDKKYREVWIGSNILKNNKNNNIILSDGIMEARRRFFNILSLEDSDIISIRKDSIFFINRLDQNNNSIIEIPFDKSPIRFIQKGIYTSFYKLKNKLVIFYNSGRLNQEIISIAGIGDNNLLLHEKYFTDFLKALFQVAELRGTVEALNLLKIFYMNYINLRLEPGYYREFNPLSMYKINQFSIYPAQSFMLEEVSDDNIRNGYIDISYNENILRTLMKIYSTKYFSEIRKR